MDRMHKIHLAAMLVDLITDELAHETAPVARARVPEPRSAPASLDEPEPAWLDELASLVASSNQPTTELPTVPHLDPGFVAANTGIRPYGGARFEIPGQPLCGSTVRPMPRGDQAPDEIDETEWRFTRRQDGGWSVASVPEGVDGRYTIGQDVAWLTILSVFGPVQLEEVPPDPLTDELYGPVGARWGQPEVPCPYADCLLGTGHVGPHRGEAGDIPPRPAEPVAPKVLPLCTCGRPSSHRMDCPRFAFLSGAAQGVTSRADG